MTIEGTFDKKCIKLMEENVEIYNTECDQEYNPNDESNLDDFFAS